MIFSWEFFLYNVHCTAIEISSQRNIFLHCGALSLSSSALFTLISPNKHIRNANAYTNTNTSAEEKTLVEKSVHTCTETEYFHSPYYFYR